MSANVVKRVFGKHVVLCTRCYCINKKNGSYSGVL
jgi:hypothetical protein